MKRLWLFREEVSEDLATETISVGRFEVLVSGPSSESELLWEGRLATQAPEVDGVVYLNDGPVAAGSMQMVEITESHDYDLVGRVVG